MNDKLVLRRNQNQTRQLAYYAIGFCGETSPPPAQAVIERTERFHIDSIGCAVSAIASRTNAPTVLRREALQYSKTDARAFCYGSARPVPPEKAVAANCAAAREWDANGTNFGFCAERNRTRGEFGHNDFYPVAIAAAQQAAKDGMATIRAMICLDEIRGRLAEVFALRDYKIDHVVHGAIASAAVYGAIVGASAEEIEHAIGMVVAHYVPFRAIRAGDQLSDSKGASAALSAEAAVLSIQRARDGFVGPKDIFRNPQALFCLFEPPDQPSHSPFDLELSLAGTDFAIMDMHFKLGLYEHQSAGAIEGIIRLLQENPRLISQLEELNVIEVTIYEPAYSIICDPAKRSPTTRQSADHSLPYIVSRVLRNALVRQCSGWKELMLLPNDYSSEALADPLTRRLMEKVRVLHGGADYDRRYPDGIPTCVTVTTAGGESFSTGLIMYPKGHARCNASDLNELLDAKFRALMAHAVTDWQEIRKRFENLSNRSADEIASLYDFAICNVADTPK